MKNKLNQDEADGDIGTQADYEQRAKRYLKAIGRAPSRPVSKDARELHSRVRIAVKYLRERQRDYRQMCASESDIAFTPAVKRVQQQKGAREADARIERGRGWRTAVTPDLAEFLADLDMFYLGTASAEGQPYIQYRGGPPGFLKVIDEHTLGFADFGGNSQYITLATYRRIQRRSFFSWITRTVVA